MSLKSGLGSLGIELLHLLLCVLAELGRRRRALIGTAEVRRKQQSRLHQPSASQGSRGRSCECVSGEQQQRVWEANGKEKFHFLQSAQCREADGLAAACRICQGVSGIVLGKEKKQWSLRKGIPNKRYLLWTNLCYLNDKIAASFAVAIFLYFLYLSSSHLPKSALPDCFTDELKATEIQSLIRIFLNCWLFKSTFLVLEAFPSFYFSQKK